MSASAQVLGDPPNFTPCSVRRCLRQANGAKLTAREITERVGSDPGPLYEPSDQLMSVIRILAQLCERGEVRDELPGRGRRDFTYWIEPPRESER